MTAFPTCHNCALGKQACERREGVKAAIRGLGITSAKLRCPERRPLFATGQRVGVSWPVGDFDDGYILETWPATVIGESRSRFLIKVDDGLSDNGTPAKEYVKNPTLFARVPAARLVTRDEPAREVCPACQRVEGGGIGENGCYGWSSPLGGYRPMRCMAPKVAA
jgi:hypothetical protein